MIKFQHQISNVTSISDNNIQDIIEDSSGDLWIATREGGLNQFNFRNQNHGSQGTRTFVNNWFQRKTMGPIIFKQTTIMRHRFYYCIHTGIFLLYQ